MKYEPPTYDELKARAEVAERKLDNISHVEHLARYHKPYRMIHVANALAKILKSV